MYHSIKVEFVRSFFGGFEDTIICFRDYLTKQGLRNSENQIFKNLNEENYGTLKKTRKKMNTVMPRDTRPLAARTSQVHVFELGPKIFEMHVFARFCTFLHDFAQFCTILHVFARFFDK